jgi:hypothetical protein
MAPTHLGELLEGVGHAVDGLKFAGGAFSVMTRPAVRELLATAHEHGGPGAGKLLRPEPCAQTGRRCKGHLGICMGRVVAAAGCCRCAADLLVWQWAHGQMMPDKRCPAPGPAPGPASTLP